MVKMTKFGNDFSALFLAKLFAQFLSDIAYRILQTFLFRTIYNLPGKFACILRFLWRAGVHFSSKNMLNLEFSRYVFIYKIGAVLTNADQRFFVDHFGSGYPIYFKSFSLTAPTGAR